MLRKFVEEKHFIFADRVDRWEDAIRLGCRPLEADRTVDETYADQIIECVRKYGPYIVIMPNIAIPHSQEGATGVRKTTISFMKINEPVHFDGDDPEKDATLFFTLASNNSEEHLANMSALSEILLNEDLMKELNDASSPEDLIRLQEQYLD